MSEGSLHLKFFKELLLFSSIISSQEQDHRAGFSFTNFLTCTSELVSGFEGREKSGEVEAMSGAGFLRTAIFGSSITSDGLLLLSILSGCGRWIG